MMRSGKRVRVRERKDFEGDFSYQIRGELRFLLGIMGKGEVFQTFVIDFLVDDGWGFGRLEDEGFVREISMDGGKEEDFIMG